MDIEKIVQDLIEEHETSNPYLLCKRLKIRIRVSNLGRVKGFFKKQRKHKYIVLNEELTEFGKLITLSHELGHGVLHSDGYIIFMKEHFLPSINSKFEREANIFAANLLIKNEYLGKYEPESEEDTKLYNELLNYIK